MQATTGLPETLEDYIDFSMIAQAEGLKFGIEHFRRRKPHCSGTLFWQLNDCWPVLSWSVLDYYGVGKAGYFYARRSYAPVLASFKPMADGLELWIVNDTLSEIEDAATVCLGRFSGGVLHREEIAIRVPANTSQRVHTWMADQIAGKPDLYISVRSARDLFPPNRHFFAQIKDISRTPVQPQMTIEPVGDHELLAHLTVSAYAYFVHLTTAAVETRFSDNYFDIEPGEVRTITVKNMSQELTPEHLTLAYR